MAVTILSVLEDARPSIGSAIPDRTLIWGIRKSAREFCRRSRYLRETVILDVVAGQVYYEVDPTMPETESIEAKAVEVGSSPLTPSSFEENPQAYGAATAWVWEPPNEVWPTPIPTKDIEDGLAVRLILQPTADAETLPDYLMRYNREAITEGSLAYILSMKNMPWYNPGEADRAKAEFIRRSNAARASADRAHRPRSFRTIPAWRKP